MVERTYLSKFNTIIEGYKINTGLNPVSELMYGKNLTRALLYFDESKIKDMIEKGIYGDKTKLKHRLKITNAGSVDFTQMHLTETSPIDGSLVKRASSFDLIFFLIPNEWDAGKGYDYSDTFFNQDFFDTKQHDKGRLLSEDGCNWFQRRNGLLWAEEGIFSNETLEKEYNNFSAGEDSIIIGRQKFDVGNENIDLDITDVFNKFMDGELKNYGIGIAFAPDLERTEMVVNNYVGFMTNKTPTFFEPFVETTYDDFIADDRANFVLNKKNKLYLYCNIGGQLTDLDEIPTCSIKDGEGITVFGDLEVKHFSQGIYYVDVTFPQSDFEPSTQYFDTWGGIVYQEMNFDDVELSFTLKPTSNWFNIGNSIDESNSFTPSVYGIDENERIRRGDVRKLCVNARLDYTQQNTRLISGMDVRLYVMDGTRELTVFDYEPVNRTVNENYIMIDTNILVPQIYHVDVRIKYGIEEIIHHDILKFEIVDELKNRFN